MRGMPVRTGAAGAAVAGTAVAGAGLAAANTVVETANAEQDLSGPEDLLGTDEEQDQADPERRRRRRRSRRGRRGPDDQATNELQTSADVDAGDLATGVANTVVATHHSPVVSTDTAVAPLAATATPSAPAPVAAPAFVPVEPPPAPVLVASMQESTAPAISHPESVPVITEVAPAPLPATSAEPIVTASAGSTPVVSTPDVTASVSPAPVTARDVESAKPIVLPVADKSALQQLVQSAGLKWVETDPARAAEANSNIQFKPIKLGREPKPVVQVSSSPLVQVETRR